MNTWDVALLMIAGVVAFVVWREVSDDLSVEAKTLPFPSPGPVMPGPTPPSGVQVDSQGNVNVTEFMPVLQQYRTREEAAVGLCRAAQQTTGFNDQSLENCINNVAQGRTYSYTRAGYDYRVRVNLDVLPTTWLDEMDRLESEALA